METPKKVKRLFSKSILLFLQQVQTMLNNFISDMAVFSAKFPLKNAAFAADWQIAIDNADDAPDDDEVLSDQKQYTIAVEAVMTAGRNAYTVLMVYVKLAFPGDVAVLDHFGEPRYRKARRNQLALKELLELAYKRANSAEYKMALINEGFLQTDIDNLNTLAGQLDAENNEQEDVKSGYSVKTQSRNELMNFAWNYMREVNLASKVVYAGNYAKLKQYLLYPEKRSGSEGGGGFVYSEITINPAEAYFDNAPVGDQVFRAEIIQGTGNAQICTTTVANSPCIGNTYTLVNGTVFEGPFSDMNVSGGGPIVRITNLGADVMVIRVGVVG